MPYLPISANDIGPARCRSTLVRIESLMLWPDNAVAQKRAEHAGLASVALDREASQPMAERVSSMSHQEFLEQCRFYADARPIADVQTEAMGRLKWGMFAASRLINYLMDAHSGREPRLGALNKELRDKLEAARRERAPSNPQLEKMWQEFRPVASLHAAYFVLGSEAAAQNRCPLFPCELDDLPIFLGIAEAYRRAGEACRLHGHKGYLLVPRSNWAASPDLELPRVDLGLIGSGLG